MPRKPSDPAFAHCRAEQADGSPSWPPADLVAQIARGAAPFPIDLPADRQTELARAVRLIRSRRLLRLIARAIAQDFAAGCPEQGGSSDAP